MSETDQSASILIIDDNREVLVLLESILRKEGYRTFKADSGEAGVELAHREVPDLVLLDLNMPGMKGLEVCQQIKANARTHDIFVVILSAITDIRVKARGFHLGAIDYINKPFRGAELLARVRAQLGVKAELDRLRREYREISDTLAHSVSIGDDVIDQSCVETEEKRLVFATRTDRLQGVVNQLLIGIGSRLNPKLRTDLALGLHEVILNAIEHGNLGINSEQKARALEDDTFEAVVRERESDPELARRRVFIDYAFDGRDVRYRIRDEGQGFDWRPFLERDEPEDLLASNGRGIMISRYIFDGVSYNDRGNEVTVRKRVL